MSLNRLKTVFAVNREFSFRNKGVVSEHDQKYIWTPQVIVTALITFVPILFYFCQKPKGKK